ncbi:MAG: hypothetical protein LQ349_009053, partial [Xanthoria aureola]
KIYGHRKEEMGKDPIVRLHTPTGAQNIRLADRETHTRQRRLLAHAFSKSALREQEPVLQLYADKLLDQLSRECHKTPLDMVAWLTLASFDLNRPHVVWSKIRLSGPRRGLVGDSGSNISSRPCKQSRGEIEKGSEHGDFLHYILAANDDKGMSPEEIPVNAFFLSIAGSESTSHRNVGYRLPDPDPPNPHTGEPSPRFGPRVLPRKEEITPVQYQRAWISHTPSSAKRYASIRPVAITLPRRACPPAGKSFSTASYPSGVTVVGVHHYSTYHHLRGSFPPGRRNSSPSVELYPARCGIGRRRLPTTHRECLQPFSGRAAERPGEGTSRRAEMRLLADASAVPVRSAAAAAAAANRGRSGGDAAGRKVQGFWAEETA